jgi:ribosomal protein S2
LPSKNHSKKAEAAERAQAQSGTTKHVSKNRPASPPPPKDDPVSDPILRLYFLNQGKAIQEAPTGQKKHAGSCSASYKRISEVLTKKRKERQFIPEVLFILGVAEGGDPLVREAVKLQIPIIGIIDSNVNPFGILYPIPGNDDSTESLSLYTQLILNAMVDSKKKELKNLFASPPPVSHELRARACEG